MTLEIKGYRNKTHEKYNKKTDCKSEIYPGYVFLNIVLAYLYSSLFMLFTKREFWGKQKK